MLVGNGAKWWPWMFKGVIGYRTDVTGMGSTSQYCTNLVKWLERSPCSRRSRLESSFFLSRETKTELKTRWGCPTSVVAAETTTNIQNKILLWRTSEPVKLWCGWTSNPRPPNVLEIAWKSFSVPFLLGKFRTGENSWKTKLMLHIGKILRQDLNSYEKVPIYWHQ